MQEQELFQSYEVKNWDFSARIYKILAFSAIFNILAILGLGQTNLLTTKGCDSPLVGKVCQVIDTLYVGGTALSTDTKYVNKPIGEENEIIDADIIWVDRTGEDLFKYPEGYLAQSNPDLNIPTEIPTDPNSLGSDFPNIPGIPPGGGGTGGGNFGGGGNFSGNDLTRQKPVYPKINKKNPVTNLPSSPFDSTENPTDPGPKTSGKKDKTNPQTDDPTVIKPEVNPTVKPDKTDKVADIEINKVPMKKLASDVKVKFLNNELDLTQNFKVVTSGVINKDGQFEITKDKKTKQPIILGEGNEQMVEVTRQAIAALSESGWLGHLRNQGIDKINFTVVQDNDNLQVIITSDLPTPERANTVTSGFNGIIQAAFLADKNGWKKLGDDEKLLLSSAKVVVNPENTKQFILNFVLPKATAQELITRKLNEPEEKTTENKQNKFIGQIKDNNKNSAK